MNPKKLASGMEAYGQFAGVGIQFVLTVLLCFWIGYWADGKLGWKPILTLVGIFFGLFAAIINLISSVNKTDSKPKT